MLNLALKKNRSWGALLNICAIKNVWTFKTIDSTLRFNDFYFACIETKHTLYIVLEFCWGRISVFFFHKKKWKNAETSNIELILTRSFVNDGSLYGRYSINELFFPFMYWNYILQIYAIKLIIWTFMKLGKMLIIKWW